MSSSPYMQAALMLSQIWETRKSIKTLAYDKSGELKINKSAYAQVCHVLEHQRTLQEVLNAVPIPCRNEGLLYVLLYELLLGPNQKIRGGGAVKRQIVNKEVQLREVLQAVYKGSATVRASFPRYVRVNTLKCTLEEAIATLKLQDLQIYVDANVPNLLVLKPDAPVHDHDFVKEGKFILQDKSSCFSALCLVHGNKVPLDGDCLDACAAPGNKTSHLASLTDSKVIACDRSEKRLEMLDRRMKLLVTNKRVVTRHVDFLKIKPTDYPNVKGILLDPSCSGSGIFTSLDRLADDNDGVDRIEHLSNFQLTALQHAMTFSSVDRIVYSTCSLHEQENELVVKEALHANPTWQLIPPYCLRHWKRRGHEVEGLTTEQSKCMIRADRGDETNGFFVAYFERRDKPLPRNGTTSTNGNVVVPTGVSLYQGEFAMKCGDGPVEETIQHVRHTQAAKSVASTRTADAKPKNVVSEPKTVTLDSAKVKARIGKVVAKKQAKKLAWKLQQVKQKKERLLMKEKPKALA